MTFSDVDKESKTLLPLLDRKIALDRECAKYKVRMTTGPEFHRWAEVFVEALETALGEVSVADEVHIDAVQSYRAKGNVAKHFFEAHAEESKNLII